MLFVFISKIMWSKITQRFKLKIYLQNPAGIMNGSGGMSKEFKEFVEFKPNKTCYAWQA